MKSTYCFRSLFAFQEVKSFDFDLVLVDLFVIKRDITAIISAINLQRSLVRKMWPSSFEVMRQLEGVGPQMVNLFVKAGIKTFEDLDAIDARKIEYIVNRNPPFGNKIIDSASKLPRFKLSITPIKTSPPGPNVILQVAISLSNSLQVGISKSGFFVCHTADGKFVDFRKIR